MDGVLGFDDLVNMVSQFKITPEEEGYKLHLVISGLTVPFLDRTSLKTFLSVLFPEAMVLVVSVAAPGHDET